MVHPNFDDLAMRSPSFQSLVEFLSLLFYISMLLKQDAQEVMNSYLCYWLLSSLNGYSHHKMINDFGSVER